MGAYVHSVVWDLYNSLIALFFSYTRMTSSQSPASVPLVSGDDLIGEIVHRYPEAAEVLMDFGVGCAGCYISEFETLEQGILGHGFTEEEFGEVLEHLNEIAQQQEKRTQKEL